MELVRFWRRGGDFGRNEDVGCEDNRREDEAVLATVEEMEHSLEEGLHLQS